MDPFNGLLVINAVLAGLLALSVAGAALAARITANLSATLKEQIVTSQQQIVDAVVATLKRAYEELTGTIEDLKVQLADAGVSELVDLTELEAAAKALDDIVPDAPAEDVVEDVDVADEPVEPVEVDEDPADPAV